MIITKILMKNVKRKRSSIVNEVMGGNFKPFFFFFFFTKRFYEHKKHKKNKKHRKNKKHKKNKKLNKQYSSSLSLLCA